MQIEVTNALKDSSTKGALKALRKIRDKYNLSRTKMRTLLIESLAELYCNGDTSKVTLEGNPTAYCTLARFLTILCNKDSNKQSAIDAALNGPNSITEIYNLTIRKP